MPLTIAGTALLGWWWLGLAPASAVLLGSALAPTDPVLASDVQVGEPGGHENGEDEVRFALTSEAGLNDALAFPFVYAAIAMATAGNNPARWIGHWFSVDVVYKLAVGVIVGIVIGRLLGWLFFRPRSSTFHLASHAEGFIALAATFLAYGLGEVAGGYGFLAVFVCALSIRASERSHEYHQVLHDFVEQIERLLTVVLLVLFGGALVGGLLTSLTWQAAALGLAVCCWSGLRRRGCRCGAVRVRLGNVVPSPCSGSGESARSITCHTQWPPRTFPIGKRYGLPRLSRSCSRWWRTGSPSPRSWVVSTASGGPLKWPGQARAPESSTLNPRQAAVSAAPTRMRRRVRSVASVRYSAPCRRACSRSTGPGRMPA